MKQSYKSKENDYRKEWVLPSLAGAGAGAADWAWTAAGIKRARMRVASIATTPNPNNCLGAAPAIFFFSSSVFLSLGCGRERKKRKEEEGWSWDCVVRGVCVGVCVCVGVETGAFKRLSVEGGRDKRGQKCFYFVLWGVCFAKPMWSHFFLFALSLCFQISFPLPNNSTLAPSPASLSTFFLFLVLLCSTLYATLSIQKINSYLFLRYLLTVLKGTQCLCISGANLILSSISLHKKKIDSRDFTIVLTSRKKNT